MRRAISIHTLKTLIAVAAIGAMGAISAPALAKLPVPSPEAKAKAAETAAKTAWNDKVGAYKLCLAGDRTTAAYRNHAKSTGTPVAAAVETPACTDPGPYVAAVVTPAPPLEAAGAHSPATTSVGPPSSKATAAELQGQKKK